MTYKPSLGTISHGTLQPGDLMISFADELRRINPDHELVAIADAVQACWSAGWSDIYEHENASELINDLEDALNEHAPPFCYFGSLEGDGSDFGFWPSMSAIDELPRVSDPNEVEQHMGEECAFVNDHGNVTVYGADGAVLIDFV